MKKILTIIMMLIGNIAYSQTNYNFAGNGKWCLIFVSADKSDTVKVSTLNLKVNYALLNKYSYSGTAEEILEDILRNGIGRLIKYRMAKPKQRAAENDAILNERGIMGPDYADFHIFKSHYYKDKSFKTGESQVSEPESVFAPIKNAGDSYVPTTVKNQSSERTKDRVIVAQHHEIISLKKDLEKKTQENLTVKNENVNVKRENGELHTEINELKGEFHFNRSIDTGNAVLLVINILTFLGFARIRQNLKLPIQL